MLKIAGFATRGHVLVAILGMLVLLQGMQRAYADQLPAPSDEPVLTLYGNISHHNTAQESIEIDMAMLESMPQTTFVTETPWTEGKVEWTGVRLNELLLYAGAKSLSFGAIALDEYEVDFKGADIDKYPVIIAYKKNGEYMSVRQLGPLWIMFPFDDFPELLNQSNMALCVWQLYKMEVI